MLDINEYCSPGWFLVFSCAYTFTQSFTMSGLFPACISSLERQYNFTSLQTGMLSSAYDLAYICVVLFVGYLGTHGNRPRILSFGLLLFAMGCFLFILPIYAGPKYTFSGGEDVDVCGDSLIPAVNCGESSNGMFAVFSLSSIFLAFGSAPLYTLVPSHLDYIVNPLTLPKYLGYFYLFAALGPALGYLIAGATLNIYVEPGKEPSDLQPGDSNWVGAWWIGWVIVTVISVLVMIPFCFFHKGDPYNETQTAPNINSAGQISDSKDLKLANLESGPTSPTTIPAVTPTAQGRTSLVEGNVRSDQPIPGNRSGALGGEGGDGGGGGDGERGEVQATLWELVKPLVTNFSFAMTTLGLTTEGFAVTGFSLFMAKSVESSFVLSSSQAALLVGIVIVPGAAGGIFFGGWLSNKLRLTPRQNALMCWVVALVAIPFLFGFFIGCDQYKLAGWTVPYNPDNDGSVSYNTPNFNATCNAGCGCGYQYAPVCSNGINYFSACYAGCSYAEGEKYGNCTCVPSVPVNASAVELLGAMATEGKCESDCAAALGGFLFLLLFIMFTTFTNNVPAAVVSLKTIPVQSRSIGISAQQIFVRVLGSVPGPLIFGASIDIACGMWEEKCGEKGNCWEYEVQTLRRNLFLLSFFPKIASFISFFLAWWLFPNTPDSDLRPGDDIPPNTPNANADN